MAIWVSRVYLRWYKAFNTETGQPLDAGRRPWNQHRGKSFPFVEIPTSPRITTIVGANETGKSQLLSAIQKVVNGSAFEKPYSQHDVCRYCGLLSTQEDLWPQLGLEFSFDTDEEVGTALRGLGITRGSLPDRKLRVFVNGGDSDYARFFDASGAELGTLTRDGWGDSKAVLPQVRFIQSKLAFSNQIHISQLLAQYEQKIVSAYEPVQLHSVAGQISKLDLPAVLKEAEEKKEGKPTPLQDQLRTTQEAISKCEFKTGKLGLEVQLFDQILKIPKRVLERIQDLRSSHNGYVEQLVDDINHRMSEALDISEYWQQDEDFTVTIEYKAGFFYFFITDRTGAKYTFDERSGDLKYFLSYYVQAKAIRDTVGDAGAVIVMDEPDGFLSAAGQRNLLSVFELLAQPENGSSSQRRC